MKKRPQNTSIILERRRRRNLIIDQYRRMEQQGQQNPGNIMEQCLALLTDIMHRHTQQPSLRSRIEKEIKYLPAFEGKAGTLPTFINSVERVLAEYGNQSPQVYAVIYDEKILGPAKNYLATAPPATWEECKTKLKVHYKPTKDQGRIMQEVYTLKVSSINDLLDKIRILVDDIAECAIYSDYQNEVANQLSSILVLKIKEITAGALAAEIHNKFSLEEIRSIINKYLGQDFYNLKFYGHNVQTKTKPKLRLNSNEPRQGNFNNNPNNFYQSRNNNSNNFNQSRTNNYNNHSGQGRRNFYDNNRSQGRNSHQHNNNNPPQNNVNSQHQPMDVDTISIQSETNRVGESEFFIN